MGALKYPLEQLVKIKHKRFEQAQKTLEEKKEELRQQEEILKKKEAERDEVLKHKQDKLQQLRDELDTGTTSDKIQQMKIYLEVVDERLEKKQKKVDAQKKKVEEAEKAVEIARLDLIQKQKDVEKLKIHKKQWQNEVRFWEKKEEGKILDEVGSQRYVRYKKEE